MAAITCPTCGKKFDSATSKSMPFCSHRCQQMDLGRWLDEKQSLPHLPSLDEDEIAPQGDFPSD